MSRDTGRSPFIWTRRDTSARRAFTSPNSAALSASSRAGSIWEAPVIVERLCGICPVSHHLAASKAMDVIVGRRQSSPRPPRRCAASCTTARSYQSHALHFFHLCSPDLLFGFDAPVEKRNVFGVIEAYPEVAKKAVLMRKFGQEVIKATGGKKVHCTGVDPGRRQQEPLHRGRPTSSRATPTPWSTGPSRRSTLCKKIINADAKRLLEFGTFESNFVASSGKTGAWTSTTEASGDRPGRQDHLRSGRAPADYLDYIARRCAPGAT